MDKLFAWEASLQRSDKGDDGPRIVVDRPYIGLRTASVSQRWRESRFTAAGINLRTRICQLPNGFLGEGEQPTRYKEDASS